jgi:hypothetical protein
MTSTSDSSSNAAADWSICARDTGLRSVVRNPLSTRPRSRSRSSVSRTAFAPGTSTGNYERSGFHDLQARQHHRDHPPEMALSHYRHAGHTTLVAHLDLTPPKQKPLPIR